MLIFGEKMLMLADPKGWVTWLIFFRTSLGMTVPSFMIVRYQWQILEREHLCLPPTSVKKSILNRVRDFLSKYDQIRSFLRIWSHLLKKSLTEIYNFMCSGNASIRCIQYLELQKLIVISHDLSRSNLFL